MILPTRLSLDDMQPSVLLAHELVKKGVGKTQNRVCALPRVSLNAASVQELIIKRPFSPSAHMTEVRPGALPLTGLAALQWLDSTLERHNFALQQIFADEVFVSLATCSLVQINLSNRNISPTEQAASLKPPLAGNKPTRRSTTNG
jgi:hypothetical protein